MSKLRTLRVLNYAEGCSLLALLFVAMPLKHLFGLPIAVRVAGSLHGILFLALLSTLFQSWFEGALPERRALRALAWAFVPFGFLKVDHAYLRELKPSSS